MCEPRARGAACDTLSAAAVPDRRTPTVLNARLYRTCWLVAGVALVVALLTLETPDTGPEPPLPSAIDGHGGARAHQPARGDRARSGRPAPARTRRPRAGSRASSRRSPGPPGASRSRTCVADDGGQQVQLHNLYLAVPGAAGGRSRAGILVVAPRDTPSGVPAGTSSTAVMLQPRACVGHVATPAPPPVRLHRRQHGRQRGHPLVPRPLLGLPDRGGDRPRRPGRGGGRRRPRLDRRAHRSAGPAAWASSPSDPSSGPGGATWALRRSGRQLMRMAVPQTFGEQGAAIADDLPAVSLSGRGESPLRAGAEPTADRLALVANAANDLLLTLDAAPQVPAPDGGLALAGKLLRPTVVRLALLLLALPIIVCAIDALARMRRARVALGDGLRAVGLRRPSRCPWPRSPPAPPLAAGGPAARRGRGRAAAAGRGALRGGCRSRPGRRSGRRRRRWRGVGPPPRPPRRRDAAAEAPRPWARSPCCSSSCGS